ncbi:hypothetical protein HHI36_022907 [Cryptolaemus montrouzieri]|uniref:Uncharacterized protein n=1 Tax=Cryptolaemus montrouzieri TaxID=559131 RepID=A0ABD2PEZ1_9CUCU
MRPETVYSFFGMSRRAYTEEELLRILENSEDEENICSDLFGDGYRDEISGSTRSSLKLGDPSTSSTLAPNLPLCRRSLGDVFSSEQKSDDEVKDPVSHDVWIYTEPSTIFNDLLQ